MFNMFTIAIQDNWAYVVFKDKWLIYLREDGLEVPGCGVPKGCKFDNSKRV